MTPVFVDTSVLIAAEDTGAQALYAACLAWLQRREPMQALGARVWWLVLPATLALLGGVSAWALPEAIQQYRY